MVARKPNAPAKTKMVGIIAEEHGHLVFKPCEKSKRTQSLALDPEDREKVKKGFVVVARTLPDHGQPHLKLSRILGNESTPGILSLISLYEQGLSEVFAAAALNETKGMSVPALGDREDLRNVPLVTIDPVDARDFDDAVFAEKTENGFHLIVAIADVSWYVQPGSALDKEAFKRGNSTYFPDYVVPMLPETLSNGLCSLKPHEDRAVVGFHIWIDNDGNLTRHAPFRGLMHSKARLHYDQVQAAKDGNPDAMTAPLMEKVINPLYEAYDLLRRARERRGAIDLDMPQARIQVDANGGIGDIYTPPRANSHHVIEEFMIIANVAAAQAAPSVFRVHGHPPSETRMEELRTFLQPYGLAIPENVDSPAAFKDVIEQAAHLPQAEIIMNAILRVQAKAIYDTSNIGHYGLALPEYAHFTSPIRRYADLLVHRTLVDAFKMGQGGMKDTTPQQLKEMAAHITATEVLSDTAERSARARFAAAALVPHVGKIMNGQVTSTGEKGIMVKLTDLGVTGFLPASLMSKKHSELKYAIGTKIDVRLSEADKFSGAIILETPGPKDPPHKCQRYQAKKPQSAKQHKR